MEISDVVKIEEVTDRYTANKYIELGWKLLHIYTTGYDSKPPMVYHQTPHFILGWTNGEPVYPKSETSDGYPF